MGDAAEKRKERLKSWFKDYHNLAFFAILIFAFAVRLYYFILTKNQPLWWDEADYMAYAKNLAGFDVHWTITGPHSSILPYIAAALFKLGLAEAPIKFILEFIPSFLIVLLTYKLCMMMYRDKRIALVSMFLMAGFWEILFNSMRFHIDVPAIFFGLLATYVFFKGYEKNEKIFNKINPKWTIPLTVCLVVITYAIRRAYFLFGLFFLFYMFSTRKFKDLVKDKYNWISGILAVALFLFVENFLFASAKITEIAEAYIHKTAFNLLPFDVFKNYFLSLSSPSTSILFYLFYLGLILLIVNIVLLAKYLKNTESATARSDLFNFLTILVTLGYFLLIQRRATSFGEGRWYFPLLLASFICIARGIFFISDYIKKYSKHLGIIMIVLLIGYGGYYELQHADLIIKNKIPSFEGTRDAGLFLKEVSEPGDIILTTSISQIAYYSEREVATPDLLLNKTFNYMTTLEEFLNKLNEPDGANIRYILVTFSEPNHPEWMRTDYEDRIEIPFMNTVIDTIGSSQHKITPEMNYTNYSIGFRLLTIKGDAFVYEIARI